MCKNFVDFAASEKDPSPVDCLNCLKKELVIPNWAISPNFTFRTMGLYELAREAESDRTRVISTFCGEILNWVFVRHFDHYHAHVIKGDGIHCNIATDLQAGLKSHEIAVGKGREEDAKDEVSEIVIYTEKALRRFLDILFKWSNLTDQSSPVVHSGRVKR